MSTTFSLISHARIFGTLLLASQFVNSASAQEKGEAPKAPYPGGSEITFEWNYSCPSGRGCS
jgi:hypothetical protein